MKGKNQDKNYIYDENYNNNMEVENMESEIKKIIELVKDEKRGENMKVEKEVHFVVQVEVEILGKHILDRLESVKGYDNLFEAIKYIITNPEEITSDSSELTVIANAEVPEGLENEIEEFYEVAKEIAELNEESSA